MSCPSILNPPPWKCVLTLCWTQLPPWAIPCQLSVAAPTHVDAKRLISMMCQPLEGAQPLDWQRACVLTSLASGQVCRRLCRSRSNCIELHNSVFLPLSMVLTKLPPSCRYAQADLDSARPVASEFAQPKAAKKGRKTTAADGAPSKVPLPCPSLIRTVVW